MAATQVKKHPRVCLYTWSLAAGGAERQLVTLARALKAAGVEVRVLCDMLAEEDGHYLPLLAQAGIPVESFVREENLELGLALIQKKPERYAGLLDLPIEHETVLRLAGRLLRMSPDILHCYQDQANCLGGCAALCAGVPGIVLSVRGAIPARGLPELADWTRPVYSMLVRQPQVRLEANSRAGAGVYAAWLDLALEDIVVTPNGIDVAEFDRQRAMTGGDLRKALGVPADAKLVVWAGRDNEVKRPLDLPAVAARVCKKLPQARFIALGRGMDSPEPFADAMREYALSNEVLFLGRREDAFSLISAADAVLLTSRMEGFPNVLLEAMYAGVPVVATEVGGVPDLVIPGEHGFLHQVGDIEGMARSLLHILSKPDAAKAMGAAGRQRVAGAFTAQHLGRNAQTLYARILAASGTPSAQATG